MCNIQKDTGYDLIQEYRLAPSPLGVDRSVFLTSKGAFITVLPVKVSHWGGVGGLGHSKMVRKDEGVRTENDVGAVDHDQSVARDSPSGVRRLKSLSRMWSGKELGLLSLDAFAPPVRLKKLGDAEGIKEKSTPGLGRRLWTGGSLPWRCSFGRGGQEVGRARSRGDFTWSPESG